MVGADLGECLSVGNLEPVIALVTEFQAGFERLVLNGTVLEPEKARLGL